MNEDEARARLDDIRTALDALEVNTAGLQASLDRLVRLVEGPLNAYLSGGPGAALVALAKLRAVRR